MESHQKHLEGSIVPEEHKHPAKRSRSNIEEEAERGRKRARVTPAEEQPREKALKRTRPSDDEEQGLFKRVRMSPPIQRGKKRSRTSDDEEEQGLSKRVRILPPIRRGIKRSWTSDDEEEQGLSKRVRMSPPIQRGIKRPRTSDDEEEQGLLKRVRMSPPIQRGIKRPRTSDAEDEVCSQKKERTSDNQGEQTFRPGGSFQISLKPQKPFGQSLEDYQFYRVLGEGGFGKVMLASLKTKHQLLAVKVINKDMQSYESVLIEKEMLQMARGSPFLCHGLAAFQTQERCYLVMDYMCGGSLDSYIMRSGVLGLKTASFYLAEIICGIQYLHSLGIIHRDLKPENVLLDGEGHVKIADFGLAVQNIIGDKKAQGRAGTVGYMAPEVITNQPYGASADYWSLGVILCCMITGCFPFNNMEYVREVLYGTQRYPDWLPSDAVVLLNKLLDKNPESRLGVNGNIREHPFFRNINWEDIEKRQLVPPFLPFTFEDTDSIEQYSFMADDSSITEDQVIPSLSFVVPEWKE